MTNFESATRNALLFRVPGQAEASKGHNERMIESIDIFPTLVELVGIPPLPACRGIDQPPTTACLQGESFAGEFTAQAVRDFGARLFTLSIASSGMCVDTHGRKVLSSPGRT